MHLASKIPFVLLALLFFPAPKGGAKEKRGRDLKLAGSKQDRLNNPGLRGASKIRARAGKKIRKSRRVSRVAHRYTGPLLRAAGVQANYSQLGLPLSQDLESNLDGTIDSPVFQEVVGMGMEAEFGYQWQTGDSSLSTLTRFTFVGPKSSGSGLTGASYRKLDLTGLHQVSLGTTAWGNFGARYGLGLTRTGYAGPSVGHYVDSAFLPAFLNWNSGGKIQLNFGFRYGLWNRMTYGKNFDLGRKPLEVSGLQYRAFEWNAFYEARPGTSFLLGIDLQETDVIIPTTSYRAVGLTTLPAREEKTLYPLRARILRLGFSKRF